MNARPATAYVQWPIFGRLLAAALLALAALAPSLPWRNPPADAIVLLDASASMPPVADTWPVIAERLAALPSGSRWTLLRYGAEAVVERDWSDIGEAARIGTPPERSPIDATASRLDRALAAGLQRIDANRPTALLVVTDGGGAGAEVEQLLDSARDGALPVLVLPVAVDHTATASIAAVMAPDLARPDSHTTVGVRIEGTAPDGANVSLLLGNERVARREISSSGSDTVWLQVSPQLAGVHRLVAELTGRDGRSLDRADGVLHVDGAPRVLLIGDGDSPVRDLLERAGLQVTPGSPADLAGRLDGAAAATGFGLIVLNDIAATRLDPTAITRLTAAVRREGTALLALGGARSFGAGAYRHSALEQLLPVVAEAREPVPPAAVVFVVDASGSMARSDAGPTRLALARRAVLDTARGLAAGDAVGLVSFDIEPAVALALAQNAEPVAALDARWPAGAGGGTRVAPAIEIAARMLGGYESDQRLLVLVTDGYVEERFDDRLVAMLRDTRIDVIAMPVGADAPSAPLARLAGINAGRLLPVGEAASLSAVMQTEIAARRAASVRRQGMAVTAVDGGWVPGSAPWPDVDGYMVTRPRAGARVLLRAPAGDPVLAVMSAGASMTAAMPAGLGREWAGDWLEWPGAQAFLADLAGWMAGEAGGGGLHVEFDNPTMQPRVLVEVLDGRGQWRNDAVPELSVRGPDGHVSTPTMTISGPGRYESPLPATREGLYVATVRTDGRALVRGHVHAPLGETDDARRGAPRLSAWLDDGRLLDAAAWRFSRPARATGTTVRPILLLAALLLYVAVLIVERRATLFPGVHVDRDFAKTTAHVARNRI